SISPDATEIYQEGICLPGIRVVRAGETQQDVIDLITRNVRLPREALGDLNAELAAVRIASERLAELSRKYGAALVERPLEHILASSEKRARAAVAALPDGVYRAQDMIDGDGNSAEQIPVCVEVRIAGEEITFDFTGSAAQRRAPINCSRGA